MKTRTASSYLIVDTDYPLRWPKVQKGSNLGDYALLDSDDKAVHIARRHRGIVLISTILLFAVFPVDSRDRGLAVGCSVSGVACCSEIRTSGRGPGFSRPNLLAEHIAVGYQRPCIQSPLSPGKDFVKHLFREYGFRNTISPNVLVARRANCNTLDLLAGGDYVPTGLRWIGLDANPSAKNHVVRRSLSVIPDWKRNLDQLANLALVKIEIRRQVDVGPQLFLGCLFCANDQFSSRTPKVASKDRENSGNSSKPYRGVGEPPLIRRLFFALSFFAVGLFLSFCSGYSSDKRISALLIGGGVLLALGGLSLWLLTALPSTWGWLL